MRLVFLLLLFPILLSAQRNDECISAINIPDISDYCSGNGAFSNVGSTPSNTPIPRCWSSQSKNNDVWFTFTPKETAVFINVSGNTRTGTGTLENPSIALYEGGCNGLAEVNNSACNSDRFNKNVVELTVANIVVGRTYYLRVSARNSNTGTFKLCLRGFNPPKSPEQDCDKATLLCDKSSFYVESLVGFGNKEDLSKTCMREEYASVWYKWICEKPGTLTFDLTPNNDGDDLDFVVYKLPGGIDDCSNKEVVRCMASGETEGQPPSQNAPCFGPTGLSSNSRDVEELPGCSSGDDNFVAALDMKAGEAYTLVVNNYSQSGSGFEIEFGGTGTFRGPKADFEIKTVDAGEFACDKEIKFTDKSTSDTDPIVSYTWNFGEGAVPFKSNVQNPPNTIYQSFGNKIAGLTVETKRGCQVTAIKEFFIEPCCDDLSDVLTTANPTNVSCFGYKDGQVILGASGGSPGYIFSVSDKNDNSDYSKFTSNPSFYDLGPGQYYGLTYDTKGCPSQTRFEITQPKEIVVNLGDDIVANLGDEIVIEASYTPVNAGDVYTWTPDEFFSCKDCLTQTIPARDNAEIKLRVTDSKDCFGEDILQLSVNKIRNLEAPNVFSPLNNDGKNDYFNVFTNKGTDSLEVLQVFDRWGGMVYNGKPEAGKLDEGWDGTNNGEPVEQGVYVWKARVRYLDGVAVTYSGDVTVLR